MSSDEVNQSFSDYKSFLSISANNINYNTANQNIKWVALQPSDIIKSILMT